MYPDNVDRSTELAYLNKEIDKVKKQLEDRQSKYESVPTPNTQVGWASYIANNDRGLLDKYQDAERAWYNKLKDQEHSKELANVQMEQQAAYRMDDNIKNRSLALNKLQYAQAALKNDTSNDPLIKAGLERDVRNAQEEVNYWNKAVGLEVDDTPKVDNPPKDNPPKDDNTPKDATTTEVKMADIDAYISGNKKFATINEQAEAIQKYKDNPAYNKDANYRDKVNKLEAVKSNEAIDKAHKANIIKWRKEYDALSPLQQRKWKKNNPNKAKAIGV